MSTDRPRIDRDTAEQLLRRGSTDAADPLAILLAAAAAPARPDELVGEQAVLAAFRAAHLGPVPQPRRRSMIQTAIAKLLTLKVAGAALAVAATGGVAVAATTGNLPGTAAERPAGVHATAKPSDKADNEHGNASPSPSLVGLCHAYKAGAGDNPGKALENPAFGALISAAGGEDKVADFCTTVLASAKPDKGGSTARPTTANEHSSKAPTDRTPPAGGKPTSQPNG
jgi:hypothetical protein